MLKYFGFRAKKSHEYVRIYVTIGDRLLNPCKQFCIDPRVTDLHTIRQLIHLAFDINRAIIIKWVTYDKNESLPVLKTLNTDRDFQRALKTCLTSLLILRIDYDLDAVEYNVMEYHKLVPDHGLMQYGRDSANGDQVNLLEQARSVSYMFLNLENPTGTEGSSSTSEEHTLTADNAKSLSDNFAIHKMNGSAAKVADLYAKTDKPLTKLKFDQMFDSDGRMTYSYSAFKLAVYQGGIEPSIRSAVWRFLLNVVDYRSTDEERKAQMESYAKKYTAIRNSIIVRFGENVIPENLRTISNVVRRDVIRTDRNVPYYGGDEDSNQHLMSLFCILVTYALTHPAVGYCQGMSDLASPILYVFDDEAEAYVAFCALMRRCGPYFIAPVNLLRVKYRHFSALVKRYEPDFWLFTNGVAIEHVLFCYRWLLLEMKREFHFDEAVDLMPIMWASIPTKDNDIPPFKPVILCDLDPTEKDDVFVLPWDYLRKRPFPPPPPPPQVGEEPQAVGSLSVAVDAANNKNSTESAEESSDDGEEENTRRSPNLTRRKIKTAVQRRDRERKTISLRLDCNQRPETQSYALSCPDDVLSQAVHRYFMEGHNRRDWRRQHDSGDRRFRNFDATLNSDDRRSGSLIRRLKTAFQDKKLFSHKSPISKSRNQEKRSRTTSCCHLNTDFGNGTEFQSGNKNDLQSKCKSAVSLLENDTDEETAVNSRKRWADRVAHLVSPKVTNKRLYPQEKSYSSSQTSSDHLASSRLDTQESNAEATPNKRIRFSSKLVQSTTSPAATSHCNGDQLNHFHDHSFDVFDHGANSDSDDSGIGTASSTLKDSSGCRTTENVSLSGSMVSEKSSDYELFSTTLNRLSNAENLAISTILILKNFSRRFYFYWSMLSKFVDMSMERDRREVFTGYKYANLFDELIGTLKKSSFRPQMIVAPKSVFSCSTKKGCDCESCQARIEKFYFTERIQIPLGHERSAANTDGSDGKSISDIEDSYDSFIIIQPSKDDFQRKTSVDVDMTVDEDKSRENVSKPNKKPMSSETRSRRINRFFGSLFRRSNRRKSTSNIDGSTSSSPSRETSVKDDDELMELSSHKALDDAESATSIPVPMAVDATEEFFDDFRRRLTLSHIHDLCSSRSSSAVSANVPTTGRRSPPSTKKVDQSKSSTTTTTAQNNFDNQQPSTSAQALAAQNNVNEDVDDISDFIVIPEDNLPPIEFVGGGNPFMIFVALAIINIYRKYFFKDPIDYDELCEQFDRWFRRYNYARVIAKARRLYASYLKSAGY